MIENGYFYEVSKSRKILYIIVAALLILLGVAIGIFLIPDLIPLIKRTPYQLLEPSSFLRHMLHVDWFLQFLGWLLAYVIFRTGIGFYRDSQKPT